MSKQRVVREVPSSGERIGHQICWSWNVVMERDVAMGTLVEGLESQ